jgi:hypothetical protein
MIFITKIEVDEGQGNGDSYEISVDDDGTICIEHPETGMQMFMSKRQAKDMANILQILSKPKYKETIEVRDYK